MKEPKEIQKTANSHTTAIKADILLVQADNIDNEPICIARCLPAGHIIVNQKEYEKLKADSAVMEILSASCVSGDFGIDSETKV